MFTITDEGKLQNIMKTCQQTTVDNIKDLEAREDDNRFHLGKLAQMAQKMDYDEQVAVAQMFDTKALFDVLQTRFEELEVVVKSVKHIFEGR